MRIHRREREAETQAGEEVGSTWGARCGSGSQDPWDQALSQRQTFHRWATQGVPEADSLKRDCRRGQDGLRLGEVGFTTTLVYNWDLALLSAKMARFSCIGSLLLIRVWTEKKRQRQGAFLFGWLAWFGVVWLGVFCLFFGGCVCVLDYYVLCQVQYHKLTDRYDRC